MAGRSTLLYRPLPGPTFIRVLGLFPGEPDDDIYCELMLANLDRDHDLPSSTAPPPMESMTFMTVKSSTGEESTRSIPIDIYSQTSAEGTLIDLPRHPFQRYTALSYVWGSRDDPKNIFMNGKTRIQVTRNLYEALKTLRLPNKGRRLWIDALCINQQDFTEKESQVRLMQRIYQQAGEVIAFVPMSKEDQDNLQTLIPRIWEAGERCEEARKIRDDAMAEKDKGRQEHTSENNTSLLSFPDSKVRILQVDDGTETNLDTFSKMQLADQEDRQSEAKNIFLEDFDLPLANDPLWASWRRLFASPYFGRIWILQEFALAKRLDFCLGDVTCRADFFMMAARYIKEYSGAMNADYVGHRHPGDPANLTLQAVDGMHAFNQMSRERINTQHGDSRENLIYLLSRAAGTFRATDKRDMIYGLLGLVRDGDTFSKYVKYSPDETYSDAYVRFASLFVERGHGVKLICQAGIRSDDSGVPSWVPDWTTRNPSHGPVIPGRGSEPTRMEVIGRSLVTTGATVDEICDISDPFEDARTTSDFTHGFTGIFRKLLEWVKENRMFQDPFEIAFHAIMAGYPPVSDTAGRAYLRRGFRSFMNFVRLFLRNDDAMKEGEMVLIQNEFPQEHQHFLSRALESTPGKKLCRTKNGFFGFVPHLGEIGDRVISINGCSATFLARAQAQPDIGTGNELDCRLVGHAYFCKQVDGDIVTPKVGKGEQRITLR